MWSDPRLTTQTAISHYIEKLEFTEAWKSIRYEEIPLYLYLSLFLLRFVYVCRMLTRRSSQLGDPMNAQPFTFVVYDSGLGLLSTKIARSYPQSTVTDLFFVISH
jgi:hypothetical protein